MQGKTQKRESKEHYMSVINQIIQSADQFYNASLNDKHGRYHSWEHCYAAFANARSKQLNAGEVDYLCLQLAFYLASWGMYRGSSFLLQKDYLVHMPVVEKLLQPDYDRMQGIACKDYRNPEVQELLLDLNSFLRLHYQKVRCSVKDDEPKSAVSDTLITKILMGTLGCVPAYDQYFCKGVKKCGMASGLYTMRSILRLVDFYEENKLTLEQARSRYKIGELLYPQMKVLDMGLWGIGMAEYEK